jgi:small subunit ribosomal protein S9
MSATSFLGLGRRKSAVARVRIQSGAGTFLVNGRPAQEYFQTVRDRNKCKAALSVSPSPEGYDVHASVHGGGPHSQAGALRMGIARALKLANPVLFVELRAKGFLTRDSRMKERKKPGRRGARRGFQFSKR